MIYQEEVDWRYFVNGYKLQIKIKIQKSKIKNQNSQLYLINTKLPFNTDKGSVPY